jgi:hypothetical protein
LTVQAVAEKSTMSAKTVEVMQAIHGTDVFANYGSLLPLDLQGWNSGHQAFRDIITKNHPAVVIDVGMETSCRAKTVDLCSMSSF